MSRNVLHGKLALHDIADVEAFTHALTRRLDLPWHQHEDLQAWLIETCWELSLDYTPGGISFSTYAGTTLRRRITDWERHTRGRTRWQFKDRTYERQLPTITPLDPDDPHPAPTGDPATDSSTDLARLLRAPGSDEAWHPHQRRPSLPRRAA